MPVSVFGCGTYLQLVLDMFLEELRQKFAQFLRPTHLVQGGCWIPTCSDLSQEMLRPRSGLIGRHDAMQADGNSACAALPASEPILHEIDFPARGRHL